MWSKWSEEAIAAVVGAGYDSTKYLTLWVIHHNCTQEGWDLENGYWLQGIGQDYTEESIPSSKDRWYVGPVAACQVIHQVGFETRISQGTSQRKRYLEDFLQDKAWFVWVVGYVIWFMQWTNYIMRLINDALCPYQDSFVIINLDDILVYSATLEDHMSHLMHVLDTFKKYQLLSNLNKF